MALFWHYAGPRFLTPLILVSGPVGAAPHPATHVALAIALAWPGPRSGMATATTIINGPGKGLAMPSRGSGPGELRRASKASRNAPARLPRRFPEGLPESRQGPRWILQAKTHANPITEGRKIAPRRNFAAKYLTSVPDGRRELRSYRA